MLSGRIPTGSCRGKAASRSTQELCLNCEGENIVHCSEKMYATEKNTLIREVHGRKDTLRTREERVKTFRRPRNLNRIHRSPSSRPRGTWQKRVDRTNSFASGTRDMSHLSTVGSWKSSSMSRGAQTGSFAPALRMVLQEEPNCLQKWREKTRLSRKRLT